MTRRIWERSIWVVTAALLAFTARQVIHGRRGEDNNMSGAFRSQPARASAMTMFDADLLDSAASRVVTHDPFRMERKPANVAFSITPNGGVGVPVPSGPPVRIALQGTIGGPPWRAIVSGIPGHDGTIIVSSGDTLGGVTIRRVDRDGVTVRVKDSTWTVTLAKAGA